MKVLTDLEVEMVSGGDKKPEPPLTPTPDKDSNIIIDLTRDFADWLIKAFDIEREIVTKQPK